MREIIIDPERCVGCGDCSLICPVKVYAISPPPCQVACPINTDVLGYISLIEQEKFDEALASIRQINPFPGIVGRVCTHPCEKECKRAEVDEPIAIRALKRSAADHGQIYEKWQPHPIEAREERVAIVGSGPAGLMAAHDLACLGYQVTIFESLPLAGGMLVMGIPEYRLPREIITTEIGQIESLGVEIRLNTKVGKDIALDALFEQGYRAILLATGAHKSLRLNIPGEDEFEGIDDAISFLQKANLGDKQKVADKAIVVGGGNAAIDSARTLLRLGSNEVNIIYRRSRQEMPAIESEVVQAEQEGVKIHYLVAPSKVLGKDGKVIGLECIRTELGEPDASGRRRPIPIKGSDFSMETDLIISAIGQAPDLSFQQDGGNLSVSEEGLLMADPDTMATDLPGVFAAGDAVTGPATVIDALAAGRKAAVSIDGYLKGESLKQQAGKKAGTQVTEGVWWKEISKSERMKIPELSSAERSRNFNEVELGLTPPLAVKEAKRCLGCGVFAHLDLKSCLACKHCSDSCWKNAITVITGGS